MGTLTVGRRTFLKGSAAAGALLALSGCKSSNQANAKTVSMYLNNPVSIDPYNVQEDQGTQVCYQLFDPLTAYDFETGELVPKAASSWESNADGTQFTFHLQDGATFHNGEPVTSQSFKRAWERLVDPNTNPDSPSAVSYHLAMVKGYDELEAGDATELVGVQCPDDQTLVVTLSEPYADFPYVATHPALSPVPEVALEDFDAFFKAPVGNGPFKMDGQWVDGQYINLVRNDDYYGELPEIEAINFNIQKDVETAYKEFTAGNLDIAEVPTAQISEAQNTYGISEDGYTITPGHQMLNGAQPSTYYITVNNENEVLKDPNLRKAISLAINRESICENIFLGTRSPADGIVPPGIQGYEEDAWEDCYYDKDAAIAILDEYYPADANGDRNINIQLSFNGDGDHKQIMEHIQADLNEVGINATLDQGEWAAILNRYQTGDYEMGRLGWIADYPILDNFLFPLFYTGNGDNRSLFSDPKIDAQLNAARQILDDDQRIAALQAVNREIGKQMPVIPIMFYQFSTVGSDKLASAYVDPTKRVHFDAIEVNE